MAEFLGSIRGIFSTKPPPVICAIPLILTLLSIKRFMWLVCLLGAQANNPTDLSSSVISFSTLNYPISKNNFRANEYH